MSNPNSRRMVYPYTFTAKLAHFPFKYYFDNSRYFRFLIIGGICCFPIFWKIQQLACSEANYANLENYRKKEREELEHHRNHML